MRCRKRERRLALGENGNKCPDGLCTNLEHPQHAPVRVKGPAKKVSAEEQEGGEFPSPAPSSRMPIHLRVASP